MALHQVQGIQVHPIATDLNSNTTTPVNVKNEVGSDGKATAKSNTYFKNIISSITYLLNMNTLRTIIGKQV